MRPNVGGERHQELKLFAVEESVRRWGKRVFVITQESESYSLSFSSGLARFSTTALRADRDIQPDVQVVLADSVRHMKERSWDRKEFVNPEVVIIECENSPQSTLISGKPSMRLFAYLMLKERYKKPSKTREVKGEATPRFVLVTWEKNRRAYKDVGLFDEVWFKDDSTGMGKGRR